MVIKLFNYSKWKNFDWNLWNWHECIFLFVAVILNYKYCPWSCFCSLCGFCCCFFLSWNDDENKSKLMEVLILVNTVFVRCQESVTGKNVIGVFLRICNKNEKMKLYIPKDHSQMCDLRILGRCAKYVCICVLIPWVKWWSCKYSWWEWNAGIQVCFLYHWCLKSAIRPKHDKHKYLSCEWRKSYIFIHKFSCQRCQHAHSWTSKYKQNHNVSKSSYYQLTFRLIISQTAGQRRWTTVTDMQGSSHI